MGPTTSNRPGIKKKKKVLRKNFSETWEEDARREISRK